MPEAILKDVNSLTKPKKHIASLTRVRLVQPLDLPRIESYVTKYTHSFFGDVNVSRLLHSTLALCIENQDAIVVAAIFLTDHPNVPSIPPWEWNNWITNLYRLDIAQPRNTCFVHAAVWHEDYANSFLPPLLRAIFDSNPFMDFVVFVVPPKMKKMDWLKHQGTRILPSGFSNPVKVQTLCLIIRQHFVTKYKIRRAVEEDNDDLVPLLHKNQKRLVQHYGEYYISEMLTRHPDSGRQIIVAEHKEAAVGILCLNEVVNVDSLNESFELVPFYGLRKPHPDDIIMPHWSPFMSFVHEDYEEHELLPMLGRQLSGDEFEVVYESTSSFESKEVEIEVTDAASEVSIDQYSILNVSSVHLDIMSRNPEQDERTSIDHDSATVFGFSDYKMHLYASKSTVDVSSEDCQQYSSFTVKRDDDYGKPPILHGELNAFSLELADARPEHEVQSLGLLLEAAFECFPDRDYCVLCVPSICPPFPLIKHFTRVAARPCSSYPQDLYVLHRNVISGRLYVREASRDDVPVIGRLLNTLSKGALITSCFVSAIYSSGEYCAYVLVSENDQIVGLAILRELEDIEYLRTHYELAECINEDVHQPGSHGLLEHVVLAPMFQRHSRFLLREIHRLSDYSALYYYIFSDEATNIKLERSLSCVIQDLFPVQPRQTIECTHPDFTESAPLDTNQRTDPPFALYVSSIRHLTLPRYEVNRRIVVVGGSDTAVAFLDALFRTKTDFYYAVFTNVTVVSPHGLPYQRPPHKARDMMFPRTNEFDYTYMQLTSLRTYVNVVYGVMTGIDRKLKHIILNNINFLPYDLLFLLCGEQFQRPVIKNESKQQPSSFPLNVFLINTETDGNNALQKLTQLRNTAKRSKCKVIVYGQSLEAYCCLAALLEYGIRGQHIVFVEPFPTQSENRFQHTVTHFNNGEVDDSVLRAIEQEGITMYKSYYFVDWVINHNTKHIVSVNFESRHRKLNVECIAMFMYNDKTVSMRTFMAVNQAGLVFDGALVVKPNCQTNDPNIYAAGTITKYSRRYYADDKAQKYYNREEIGQFLGQQIRKLLIPVEQAAEEEHVLMCEHLDKVLPTYNKPLMVYCNLPGGLYYFKISKPGKQVPLEVAMSADDYGQVIITGDITNLNEDGYFSLHLSQYGIVETITCLSKKKIEYRNLKSIWGKHEKLLNNLLLRFEMGLITDLFEYFQQPWCYAIYHDRFRVLEDDLYRILTSLTRNPGESLIEDVIKLFQENSWKKLPIDQIDEVEAKFVDSEYYTLMLKTVMDFILNNSGYLPMYAHPELVTVLLHGCESSPFFEPQ